jgi:hypothetical protein
VGLGLLLLGCFPSTTRPSFLPQPTAAAIELQLEVPKATRALALALNTDSIPIRRTEPKDGWLESEWFDANTLKPTTARHLGLDVVKVRAWVDPARPSTQGDNHSIITVETVYRPMADPSRSDRDLEREVPATHPIAGRVLAVTTALAKKFGGMVDSVVAPPKKP